MPSIGFWLRRIRETRRRSPRSVLIRARSELAAEVERFRVARHGTAFDAPALLRATGASGIDELWARLAARPYFATTKALDGGLLERLCSGESTRVREAAARVLDRTVDLLGTGPTKLGRPIDWHVDFKTGARWSLGYGRRIEYTQLDRPSDVKVPWELSRLQWVIPAGQSYLLTRDERYAEAVREILDEWIAANPYGWSVNWAVTMEVALRIVSWTWFFHVFSESDAWSDARFRERFLRSLYLHCVYAERNVERAEVNGNHYVADGAGLAVGGLFFGDFPAAERWARVGWAMLEAELPRQVHPDGVDFEASTAYHRLVAELYFLPALFRTCLGLPVGASYCLRAADMARFAVAYCRPDGSSPRVGDADDGRALPLGGQALGDHRYLGGLVGVAWQVEDLRRSFSGPLSEIAWLLGPRSAAGLGVASGESVPSSAFPYGGFYVMRGPRDHVFIDCGPVGFGGRGGHGHNDALSFEAWLDGQLVISDSGAYVYTADYRARNTFRATAAHNTPIVDGEEQNRFVRPEYLWLLRDDARPEVSEWRVGARDRFRGSHTGYRRLGRPVTPTRTIVLDEARHLLVVHDELIGDGAHDVLIPFHLAPGLEAVVSAAGLVSLGADGRRFGLSWSAPDEWDVDVRSCLMSPSYGVAVDSSCVSFHRRGALRPLLVTLGPDDGADHLAAARRLLDRTE